MTYKKSKCNECKKKTYIYSKGKCQTCYWKHRQEVARTKRESKGKIEDNKKPLGYLKPFKMAKKHKLRSISKKQKERLKEYAKRRKAYLSEHTQCEVYDCNNKSTHIHHKKGRFGDRLNDIDYFMAVCNNCHPKRIHETDVSWAKKMGYLLTR